MIISTKCSSLISTSWNYYWHYLIRINWMNQNQLCLVRGDCFLRSSCSLCRTLMSSSRQHWHKRPVISTFHVFLVLIHQNLTRRAKYMEHGNYWLHSLQMVNFSLLHRKWWQIHYMHHIQSRRWNFILYSSDTFENIN